MSKEEQEEDGRGEEDGHGEVVEYVAEVGFGQNIEEGEERTNQVEDTGRDGVSD